MIQQRSTNMIRTITIPLLTLLLSACGGGTGAGDESTDKTDTPEITTPVDNNRSIVNISSTNLDNFEGLSFSIFQIDNNRGGIPLDSWSETTSFNAKIGESYKIRVGTHDVEGFACHTEVANFTATKEPLNIELDPEDFCFERVLFSEALDGITDSNLKACIFSSRYTYADEFTQVDCDTPIKSLDGLEGFRFITHLLLTESGDELTSVSLNLHDLYDIRISHSNVSEVSFVAHKISQANFYGSPITSLDYDQFKTVTRLNVSHTKISTLDLSQLPRLEDFVGRGLDMETFNVNDMPNLVRIEMDGNSSAVKSGYIKNFNVENNPNLEVIDVTNIGNMNIGENLGKLARIDCDCVDLDSISISPTLDIKALNVVSNRPLLMNVDIQRMTELTYLRISGFAMGYNMLDLSLLTKLKHLTLANIVLGDLKLPPSGIMKTLYLSHSLLATVPQGIAQALEADTSDVRVSLTSTAFTQDAQDEFDALELTFPLGSFYSTQKL